MSGGHGVSGPLALPRDRERPREQGKSYLFRAADKGLRTRHKGRRSPSRVARSREGACDPGPGGSSLTRMNALPSLFSRESSSLSRKSQDSPLSRGNSPLSRESIHPCQGRRPPRCGLMRQGRKYRPGCGGISVSLTRPGGTVSLLVPGRGYLPPSARPPTHGDPGTLRRTALPR